MTVSCVRRTCALVVVLLSSTATSQTFQPSVPVIKVGADKVKAHGKELSAVAMSRDGKWLASGSYDKTIKLWSLPSGELVQTWSGHQDKVTDVTFSPDGRFVAAASEDKTVSVWSIDAPKPVASLTGHTQWVQGIRFAPDGRVLLTYSAAELKAWSVPDGKSLATVPNQSMSLERASFTPDAKLVAFPVKNAIQFVSIPDLQSGPSLACGEGEPVRRIALSADGSKLVAACAGGLRVWSLANRELVATIPGEGKGVNVLAVSEDAATAATGDAAGVVRVWNLSESHAGASLTGHTGAVISLALSKDGRILASGSSDSTVRLWSPAQNTAIAVLEGHRGSIRHLYVTPDETTVISGQEWGLEITGRSGNSINARKISADAWIALWDVSPPKFRRFLGR